MMLLHLSICPRFPRGLLEPAGGGQSMALGLVDHEVEAGAGKKNAGEVKLRLYQTKLRLNWLLNRIPLKA
jgi:hypothetical protein